MPDARLTVRFDGDTAGLQRKLDAAKAAVRSYGGDEARVRATLAQSVQHFMRQETASFREQAAARVRLAEESARGVIRAERSVLAAMRATREMAMAGGGIRPRGWDGEGVGGLSAATRRKFAPSASGQASAGGVTVLGRQIGTAAVALAAARQLRDFAAAATEVHRASQRAGTSATEWQRLAYAADQTGASGAQVEVAIRNLQKRIVDGTPEAKRAFAVLNLEIDELRNLSPDALFTAVGQAVAAVEDPARRTAAAMALFGESGTALIPMLRNLQALKDAAPTMSDSAVAAAVSYREAVARYEQTRNSAIGWTWDKLKGGVEWAGTSWERGSLWEDRDPEAIRAVEGADEAAATAERRRDAERAAAEEKRAAEAMRAAERAEFAAQMEHRRKLAQLEGREPDRVAERAAAIGLPGVEGLGGGDKGRGLEVLAAQERAYSERLAERTRAQKDAAAEAETAEERRVAAAQRAEEQIADLAADETGRQRLALDRQIADYAAAGVARERLAELRAAGIAEIERDAAERSARDQEAAYRKAEEASKAAARTAKAAAREAADAAREAFGFELPERFAELLARTPRQSARARREARESAEIADKVQRLEGGERVHFTARERRRLAAYERLRGQAESATLAEADQEADTAPAPSAQVAAAQPTASVPGPAPAAPAPSAQVASAQPTASVPGPAPAAPAPSAQVAAILPAADAGTSGGAGAPVVAPAPERPPATRPRWAVDQERLRPAARPQSPGLAARLEASRSALGRGGAAVASAARTARLQSGRIGLGREPGAATPAAAVAEEPSIARQGGRVPGPRQRGAAEAVAGGSAAAAAVAAGTRSAAGADVLAGKLDVLATKLDGILTELRAGGLV